jgi:SusD family.
MRNPLTHKSIRAATLAGALLLSPILGCTDLTEVPKSAITPDQYYKNESEVVGGLASVYATMQQVVQNGYDLSEITTDEMVVPTRGSDWYDNGQWLDLHYQTYTPNSSATLAFGEGAWQSMFQGVARANVLLDALQSVDFADKKVVTAEIRGLRAYYYFLLQDLFGGVPIVTDIAVTARPANTRAEVFAFIESELKAARTDLPVSWPASMNGRLTKGATDAILASLYLNAEVFTGTVTTAGLQKGTAHWQDAIDASDRIINSGQYSLMSDWRKNFTADNYSAPEIIMAAKFAHDNGQGLDFLMRALHYNQYTPSPWNGFSALADTYFAFNGNDIRKQIFLAGPQVNIETGLPVKDRAGNPLIFDPNIIDPTAAPENAGARIVKWPNDPAHVAQNNGNDYATFRLGEIYLTKAEAMNELGQTAQAVALVNSTTRARAFAGASECPTCQASPNPIVATNQQQFRDAILQERLFELTAEGKRRQDLIRMGKFTSGTWTFKPTNTPAYKVLMPIPQPEIDNNPLLKQNAGY